MMKEFLPHRDGIWILIVQLRHGRRLGLILLDWTVSWGKFESSAVDKRRNPVRIDAIDGAAASVVIEGIDGASAGDALLLGCAERGRSPEQRLSSS